MAFRVRKKKKSQLTYWSLGSHCPIAVGDLFTVESRLLVVSRFKRHGILGFQQLDRLLDLWSVRKPIRSSSPMFGVFSLFCLVSFLGFFVLLIIMKLFLWCKRLHGFFILILMDFSLWNPCLLWVYVVLLHIIYMLKFFVGSFCRNCTYFHV